MEPPRHRARRRRRMAVRVTLDGWSARCAEHGLPGD
ncbi:biotin synthase auxiliary protein BsaP [Streptosporangium canum]